MHRQTFHLANHLENVTNIWKHTVYFRLQAAHVQPLWENVWACFNSEKTQKYSSQQNQYAEVLMPPLWENVHQTGHVRAPPSDSFQLSTMVMSLLSGVQNFLKKFTVCFQMLVTFF